MDATGPLGPLILDLEGVALTADERELLRHPLVGGLILFSRNYQSVAQLQRLVEEVRTLRPELLLAVDHEGGRVQRFRAGFTRLPPMAALGALYQRQPQMAQRLAQECGWLLASELSACGLDLSFTPVLDLDDGCSQVIGDRAFAGDPDVVGVLARALMEGLHEAGFAAVGKHFPGHGSVAADSHQELPVDERSFDAICARDLKPFSALLKAGMDAVMPAHVCYPRCDANPAGFSRFWLQRVLREQLGFQGLIFSDDLGMGGAAAAGGFAARARAALEAGCDLLLVCNDRVGAWEVLTALETQPPAPSPRLAQLRRPRARPCWGDLQQSRRWREAVAALARLQGPGGEEGKTVGEGRFNGRDQS